MLCCRWAPYARRRTLHSSPALPRGCVCVMWPLSEVQVWRSADKEAPAAEDARTQPQTPQTPQTEGPPTEPCTPYTGQNVC